MSNEALASPPGEKVLVIDDSNTIRRSAEIFLKQGGYQVLLAEDETTARARLFEAPTVLVLDPTRVTDLSRFLHDARTLHPGIPALLVCATPPESSALPERTRVVSTQIYGHVEALEYAQAHWLSAGMVLFSFLVLLALARLNRDGEMAALAA